MRVLRESSLGEYAEWYLQREAVKGSTRSIPDSSEQMIQEMRNFHEGKMRGWFDELTRWHIVELNLIGDLQTLVFLESKWTKETGLVIPSGANYRILDQVGKNAIASHYLEGLEPTAKHTTYYDSLMKGSMKLAGADRIAICTAEPSEIASNPAASYYLLDGVGRCLPYMILLQQRKREFAAIEAFRAERNPNEAPQLFNRR